jgi:hypothetical protein
MIYERLEKYEDALEYFNEAISIEPKNQIFIFNRGCINKMLNKLIYKFIENYYLLIFLLYLNLIYLLLSHVI